METVEKSSKSSKETSEPVLNVSKEFIEENRVSAVIKKYAKKAGGPYTKDEKIKRQNEVHRLHFDYGYSARKIAELMKMSRSTVNSDLDYWYSKILQNDDVLYPEAAAKITLERLDIQRSRLREQLDKASSLQEKITIERMMYEIDSKILNTYNRMADSMKRVVELSTQRVNEWLEKNNSNYRYTSFFDKISVSSDAQKKINSIIEKDRKRNRAL